MSLEIKKFLSNGLETLEPGQPVVVFLHGYGADERDLPDLMSYLPKLPWVSLRAPIESQFDGFAWYPITNALNPSEEDVTGITESIWNWIEDFIPAASKLILVGFSQGALMATQLLRTRPERILGTVILSGFIYSSELPKDKELQAFKPKVIYCRGLQDQMISQEAVVRINTWLQQHTKAITKTYEGLGHSVNDRVMKDVADYIKNILN
jgi:phospholipase/carboxylesterase